MADFSERDGMYEAGGRVYLRRLTPDDVTDTYLSWFRDSVVTEFLTARNLSRNDVVAYIIDGAAHKQHFMYGIFDADADTHIGNIKVGPISWRDRVSDLPCVIGRRECWGKGLAKEAIRLGSRVAFEVYDMRKLSAGVASENIGSIKAYTGAGWVIEATMKGQHLVNGAPQDRVVIGCFNPKYFPGRT